MIADAEPARRRHRRGAIPPEGLGHLAAALLGHADPDDLLREGRRRAGAVRPAAGRAAEASTTFTGRGDSPLAQVPEFVNVDLSEVRRSGAARDRHDGHVRRLVVVFPALLRSAEHRAAVRSGGRRLLDAGRFLQRRRRARDSAPALLAVLHARAARRRPGRVRRAVQAPAHAGHGAQGRRRDVEVEGQRRRSRRHARRSTAPMRCACT